MSHADPPPAAAVGSARTGRSATRARRSSATPYLLMSPALLALAFSFVAPLVWLMRMSLNESNYGTIIPAFSLETYVSILSDSYYLSLLRRTMELSFTCALIFVLNLND